MLTGSKVYATKLYINIIKIRKKLSKKFMHKLLGGTINCQQ